MSVKIALLKSGETLISDVKELVTGESEEDQKKVYGYLFINKLNKCQLFDNLLTHICGLTELTNEVVIIPIFGSEDSCGVDEMSCVRHDVVG